LEQITGEIDRFGFDDANRQGLSSENRSHHSADENSEGDPHNTFGHPPQQSIPGEHCGHQVCLPKNDGSKSLQDDHDQCLALSGVLAVARQSVSVDRQVLSSDGEAVLPGGGDASSDEHGVHPAGNVPHGEPDERRGPL
jgi:hypothetical protein